MKHYLFSLPTCKPCREIKLYIHSIELSIDIEEVDLFTSSELAEKFNILKVPQLIVEKEDGSYDRYLGFAEIKRYLLDFQTK